MWIIQDIVFGDETKELIKSLEKANIKYSLGFDYKFYSNFIVRGTIDFVDEVVNFHNKIGLPYINITPLTLDHYSCHNYYKYFGDRMMNSDYIILPWWYLPNKKSQLFDLFPGEELFIRPNSGKKIFTGTTISKKWFEKELQIIKNIPFNNIKDNDLILISSYKEIYSEYRLLFYKNILIDWTQYEGEDYSLNDDAIDFISKIPSYFPDILYTLDLVKIENGFKILELNSFSSAGLYNMDFDKIVKEVK